MASSMTRLTQTAMKWAPRLMAALEGLERLNKRFPDAPGKAAAYARQLGGKLGDVRARRSSAGRLRHTLTVVREATSAMETDRPGDAAFAARAAAWRRRANDLEAALTLADSVGGRAGRKLAVDLRAKTDLLARDVIDALAQSVRSAADEADPPVP
ncbi:hypothetical protein [Cellulomonas fengjieae]|uniref:CHAD domain-containing protein n=1 Tax=Cellulomonas fengjieae TaxID=2819978 RepID=A0ABS3SBD0_9CELL|nr:hypothetical protein [Cellulomonas fengjieae]MBO3083068.1 hypothetical protein [Cellulomonas fengjieae]QVI65562.1 hypothetical protein KG102_15920 [Cellulomonas fengjieae]